MKGLHPHTFEVLLVLADEMMYWRKTGVFPSQQRILNELEEKFIIIRGIRTLNRWLSSIEGFGLFRRKKRHKKDSVLGWIFHSSLYTITGPGWAFVIRNSKYTWDQFSELIKESTATFRKPKNPRTVFRSSGDLKSLSDVIDGLVFDSS